MSAVIRDQIGDESGKVGKVWLFLETEFAELAKSCVFWLTNEGKRPQKAKMWPDNSYVHRLLSLNTSHTEQVSKATLLPRGLKIGVVLVVVAVLEMVIAFVKSTIRYHHHHHHPRYYHHHKHHIMSPKHLLRI